MCVPSILRAARSLRADVIALTTHGRSDDSFVLFGEVASEILHESDVPVVVVNSRTCGVGLATAGTDGGVWI